MNKLEINIPELEHINTKIDKLMEMLKHQVQNPKHIIYSNDDFIKLMQISKSKAALLRTEGKISYSKESKTGTIYYLLSDILEYVNNNRYEKF